MQMKSLVLRASLGMGNKKNSPATPKNAATYLLEHNPQISDEMVHMQVQLPEVTVQYIV